MAVFTGNANPALAHDIARHLMHAARPRDASGGSATAKSNVELMENVRGRDVFIVQPTCPPANDHLMELLVMVDACRRASAARITAVMPYFGYARQDRRPRATRVPITAKLVANMIASAGVDRAADGRSARGPDPGILRHPGGQRVRVAGAARRCVEAEATTNMIVVSPDVGGVVRARALAKRLDDADLAIIDKRRPRPNESQVMNIIGEVEGKTCVLIDDLVDTAGTLCQAAQALKDEGAKKVVAYITHPVLSGNGGRADREVGARRAGGDGHDSAARSGARTCTQDPPAVGRGAAGGDHAPHPRRGVASARCTWIRRVRLTAVAGGSGGAETWSPVPGRGAGS